MTSQVIGGSISGGAAGYKATGSWYGAVAGAILGAFGGAEGDKAAKFRRAATNEEQRSAEIQRAAQRRQVVRSVYLARAEAVASIGAQETGGLESSAAKGAISSIGSQGIANIKFFDALSAREIVKNWNLKKAGKHQETSDLISGFISSLGGGGGGGGGMSMGGMGGGGGGSSSSGSGSNQSSGMSTDTFSGYNA